MIDLDLLELPIAAQVSRSGLFWILLAAPRRDCFFFRWTPEVRLLALIVSPALLILWPVVLYGWFLKCRGIAPEDLDYFDED